MILLWGIPSEPSVEFVHAATRRRQDTVLMFNQRWVRESTIDVSDAGGGGTLAVGDHRYALEDFTGVLLRPMDYRRLPELKGEPDNSPAIRHSHNFHETLSWWANIADAVVMNRPEAMTSNASKPYQSQLIAKAGFAIPDTVVTTDPEEVAAFHSQHGRLFYKSISGHRSIVRELLTDDLERLADICWCPVQFQQYILGEDVRVHVVGQHVFATAVASNAIDYRYVVAETDFPQLRPIELDDALKHRCVTLATHLGLAFAGIDLRLTPDGKWYCFEVNPSPAFSYYEAHTGQPIAAAVAEALAG
jgi:glutathione synthase/RimK-type ligase-like ATP-grasp enzyme